MLMNTRKYFYIVIGFATGAIFSLSLLGLFAFTSGPNMPGAPAGLVKITKDQAQTFVNNYLTDAAPIAEPVKGFTLQRAQLDAMNKLVQENSALTGFRIYLGKDANAAGVGIVVGLDKSGSDALSGSIYSTDGSGVSPCPPICDATSPIGSPR